MRLGTIVCLALLVLSIGIVSSQQKEPTEIPTIPDEPEKPTTGDLTTTDASSDEITPTDEPPETPPEPPTEETDPPITEDPSGNVTTDEPGNHTTIETTSVPANQTTEVPGNHTTTPAGNHTKPTTAPPTTTHSSTSIEPTTSKPPPTTTTTTLAPEPPPTTTQKPALGHETVIIAASVGAVALLVISSVIGVVVYLIYRSNRQQDNPPTCSEVSIAGVSSQPEKPHYKPGDAIPGAPPPGPKGWEPDHLSPSKFKHMGALKINADQPVIMDHELDHEPQESSVPTDQHVVWDDDENKVFDIGSEVEEVYKDGHLVKRHQSKRSKRPAKRGEAGNLRVIRED